MKGKEKLQISLKAARVNAGLTQVDVAKKIGKNKATIIQWERGTIIPDIATVAYLAGLYKVPVECISLPSNIT